MTLVATKKLIEQLDHKLGDVCVEFFIQDIEIEGNSVKEKQANLKKAFYDYYESLTDAEVQDFPKELFDKLFLKRYQETFFKVIINSYQKRKAYNMRNRISKDEINRIDNNFVNKFNLIKNNYAKKNIIGVYVSNLSLSQNNIEEITFIISEPTVPKSMVEDLRLKYTSDDLKRIIQENKETISKDRLDELESILFK